MCQDITKYINDRLFTDIQPVIYTDLTTNFQLTSSRAKRELYNYYCTTNGKVSCVVVVVRANGSIQLVQDSNVEDHDIVDAFIYGFNPTEQFTCVNRPLVNHPLTIKNCHEVSITKATNTRNAQRAKSVADPVTAPVPSRRSHTFPEVKPKQDKTEDENDNKKSDKFKNMGLQSTRLLQKMKQEREAKEQARLQELQKRKDNARCSTAVDTKTKKQNEELAKLFEDEDEDDDDTELKEEEKPNVEEIDTQPDCQVDTQQDNQIDPDELENLLDTTADESLMEISSLKKQQQQQQQRQEQEQLQTPAKASTYIDEDGYIVTQKPATPTKRTTQRTTQRNNVSQKTQTKRPQESATTKGPKKKVQKSLMSFFGKK